MKRYAVFTASFALVPIIGGPFVVSTTGRASGLEWAHTIAGYATIYLVLGLLLKSVKNRQIRLPAIAALVLALLEAVPGMPRLHATVSPVLFASLAWAVAALPSEQETDPVKSRGIFAIPALVLLPILYGVGYRHKASGFLPHIGVAVLVAGLLLGLCMVLNERYPSNMKLRTACNLAITAVLFQVLSGIVAFIIRMLEIEGGLLLAYARTAHITGAALVLAASTELAIQYRRKGVGEARSTGLAQARETSSMAERM